MQSITDYRALLDEMYARNLQDFTPPGLKRQKVLISVTSGRERAVTLVGVGDTLDHAYRKAKGKALKRASSTGQIPRWVYMGFVDGEEALTLEALCQEIRKSKKHYFRKGIALDDGYHAAFPEQEVNSSALIAYGQAEGEHPTLNRRNITRLLNNRGGKQKRSGPYPIPDRVWTFTCKGWFHDGEHHALQGRGLERNLRLWEWNKEFVAETVEKSGEYLKGTVREDGRFVYGYFPPFGQEIPSYNAIRHCLSVMALLEVYVLTGDRGYENAIHRSFRYFLERYIVELDSHTAAVVDWDNGEEIRLGALGLCIVMLLQYGIAFGTESGIPLAHRLANCILSLQDETGQFTHVLQYPSRSVKDRFRIVYYPGEACYGLMQLYGHTKEPRYLEAVEKAFGFFIDNHYETYGDHWLSYAANELTRYRSEDRYYRFGLENAFSRLEYMLRRITTWPTFLELLNAAIAMVERIRQQEKGALLAQYDTEKLLEAVEVRAKRQLNGVLFPEMAMFFQNPDKIAYGVMIRHHFFRVRDDDVAHHLIGYCHYLGQKRL